MSWQNIWSVTINGTDISAGLRPHLTAITVTDKDGTAGDTLSITVDDTGGQFRMPDEGSRVTAAINGVRVFEGTVDKVRSQGSRSAGLTLSISAKGYDTKGKAKQPQALHKDDATLEEFLGEVAENAGYSLTIDPELGGISRDYWAADSESFLHVGQKMAREMNATFKLRGDRAVFAKRGKNTLAGISAAYGKNLISWDISPLTGRGLYASAKVRYFDRDQAAFEEEETDFSAMRPAKAVNIIRAAVKDKDQAKQVGEARKGEAEREGGEGSATIDINPSAQTEALITISGARPGIDGTYRMVTVTHSGSRGSGNTTSVELKQPGGGAGSDSR
ncbi:late control D family protein [uncultured Hoeflea sp.]|uniref:phage late control D family protein n=1 Tax=uncultured Hoeflea sp. TaxID=538666 RepID=UPI0030DA3A99|tara:strand:+ start:376 stop:1374 length:999 start_codon:yes stop_codon:yes gene_type:complete